MLIGKRVSLMNASPQWAAKMNLWSAKWYAMIMCHGTAYETDEMTSITPKVLGLIDKQLLNTPDHPLNRVKRRISAFFSQDKPHFNYEILDDYSPIVTPQMNFDSLYTPKDHVSRNKTDTYYFNKDFLLRPHTSAHQVQTIARGKSAFLVFGDVYRRDELDRTHYPVFHQVEIVKLFTRAELAKLAAQYKNEGLLSENGEFTESSPFFCISGTKTEDAQAIHDPLAVKLMILHHKRTMEDLLTSILGPADDQKWIDAYFPFTHPSLEYEILQGGKWIEVFGSGVMLQQLLTDGTGIAPFNASGVENKDAMIGWAAGIGLERLAMILYGIQDIRLFWTDDERFMAQFRGLPLDAKITFKPYSLMPPCNKDISFWVSAKHVDNNDVYDLFRDVAGDLIESVTLVDEFKKAGRVSKCFRIVYRSLVKTLTNGEINKLHAAAANRLCERFEVEIR